MLGFALNKEKIDFARAEADAVVGVKGRLSKGMYVVDVPYDVRYCGLAFTKAIYRIRGSQLKKIVDLKINQFEKRRAHLLTAGHPAMTHPRLARAMVNLSGATREVLDPFCGAGGILIEAGLCGLKTTGFDIDAGMLERAHRNLNNFEIKSLLEKKDATQFRGTYETVVTDLPFGLSTKLTVEAEKLYLSFLKNLKRNKIKKAVVGFPDFVDHKLLVKKAGFNIRREFTYYLHKSLSKKIVVIA
jgi:tRNA (guanine10-N2)-dimethyltransferase